MGYGFGFGFGLEESHLDGVHWVDDMQLATGAPGRQAVAESTTAEEAASPALPEPALPPEPVQAPAEGPTVAAEVFICRRRD